MTALDRLTWKPGDVAVEPVELAAKMTAAADPKVRAGAGTAPAKTKAARSGLAPGFSPVSRGAAPAGQRQAPASLAAPPPRRGKITPLTPMRVQTAKSMSRLAGKVKESHPDLPAGQHLMDAARTMRQGNHEASQRHLRAALFSLTPQSLMRNGMHTDDLHIGGRAVMHDVYRHLLLVKDLDDVAAKNQAAIARSSYGDDTTSAPMPQPPAHDAGYGPGALAQKPTARQPGADRALNAPNRADGGGSDPAVADPVGKQPAGSKQFTREAHPMGYTWNDVSAVIDLCAGDGPGLELARPWLPSTEYWASVGKGGGSHPPDKGADPESQADQHIKDAKTASMQGNHAGAAAHLARASALTSDPAKQSKINTVGKGAAQMAMQAGKGSAFQLANDRTAVTLAGPKG